MVATHPGPCTSRGEELAGAGPGVATMVMHACIATAPQRGMIPMGLFQHDIRNGTAWVTFDSGGMNTLSQAAGTDLQAVTAAIAEALAIKMVDALVPSGADVDRFAETYLRETVPGLVRETPPDLANAEALKGMILPMIQRATMGRPNPRAPYVALDVMVKGAGLPLREG